MMLEPFKSPHVSDDGTLPRQPERLTEEEKEAIHRLAEDVPSLWKAESTTAQDRLRGVRIMLDRVVIQVFGETERAEIKSHWAGGIVTTIGRLPWRGSKRSPMTTSRCSP